MDLLLPLPLRVWAAKRTSGEGRGSHAHRIETPCPRELQTDLQGEGESPGHA
jgi:hypothetical protein